MSSKFFFSFLLFIILSLFESATAFPHYGERSTNALGPSTPSDDSKRQVLWSPSQLIDVTGAHAYQDPLPGQSRGPCPAQNALANHGYLDRSGYTTFAQCFDANIKVFNMSPEMSTLFCFIGQFTSGNLAGLVWAIGNDTTPGSPYSTACPPTVGGVLGSILNPIVCTLQTFFDHVLGTPGSGMAQSHNSCEGDRR
jgi:hypothetical protein